MRRRALERFILHSTSKALSVLALILAVGCSATEKAPRFSYEVDDGPRPWKTESFGADPDRFTFAVHGDLTGGERPEIFATAMRQLALLRPEFVISAGDLIEGGGERAALESEWDSFDERAALVGVPVFYVGGNHDVSSETERAVWSDRNGPLYYHFRYDDALFLVLDSEDLTPARREEVLRERLEALEIYKTQGREAAEATAYANSPERRSGAIGETQADYFVDVIAANPDARHVFVFVHKPIWDAESTPFSRIEAALADRPYTVFNGHVHVYEHRVRNGRDYIQVATTGGGQFPDLGPSEDHVTLVTLSGDGTVDIVTLLLEGIRDKTGAIPGPAGLCFAKARCGSGD